MKVGEKAQLARPRAPSNINWETSGPKQHFSTFSLRDVLQIFYFAQPASVLFQLKLNKFPVTDFFEIHLEDLGDLRGIYHWFALLFCFVLYSPFYVKRLYTHNETESLVWNGFNIFLSRRCSLRKTKKASLWII